MKKAFILTVALLLQLTAFSQEQPFWRECGKTLNVKGGAGIEQFVEAILGTKPGEWDHEATYDRKNGYFSYQEEGAGHIMYNMSYWNKKDGNKLVIVSYEASDFGKKAAPKADTWGYASSFPLDVEGVAEDEGINFETGFMAYVYDNKTQKLSALKTPPFNGFETPQKAHYFLELPREGKDIIVHEKEGMKDGKFHTLKWNGTTFDFKKEGNGVVSFYFTDPKANIRTAPNGKVVHTLQENGSWGVGIIKIENGWCLINGSFLYEYEEDGAEELTGSNSGYWVHSSCIGGTGMGDGGVKLYASPDLKSSVVYRSIDSTTFHPVELRGEWIKVRVERTNNEGWMKVSEICSNPLTNCC